MFKDERNFWGDDTDTDDVMDIDDLFSSIRVDAALRQVDHSYKGPTE